MMRSFINLVYHLKLKKWFIPTNLLVEVTALTDVQMAATNLYLGKQEWQSDNLFFGLQIE